MALPASPWRIKWEWYKSSPERTEAGVIPREHLTQPNRTSSLVPRLKQHRRGQPGSPGGGRDGAQVHNLQHEKSGPCRYPQKSTSYPLNLYFREGTDSSQGFYIITVASEEIQGRKFASRAFASLARGAFAAMVFCHRDVLCIVGWLATSPASTHWRSIASLSHDSQEHLQTLPNVR